MNILGVHRCRLYPKQYYKKITNTLVQAELWPTPKREKKEEKEKFISKPQASIPTQVAPQAMAWPSPSVQASSCVSN